MISVTFENLDEVTRGYDPKLVRNARHNAVKRLTTMAATQVSRIVRDRYPVKAGRIKRALRQRLRRNGVNASQGFLIYTSPRLSLTHFATNAKGGGPGRSARPKVKTRRGIRYGARVRVLKRQPSKVVKGAFWANGRNGAWQIFKRETLSRSPIRKLSGPSVSHMMRSADAIAGVEKLVQQRSSDVLSHELDFQIRRRAGLL